MNHQLACVLSRWEAGYSHVVCLTLFLFFFFLFLLLLVVVLISSPTISEPIGQLFFMDIQGVFEKMDTPGELKLWICLRLTSRARCVLCPGAMTSHLSWLAYLNEFHSIKLDQCFLIKNLKNFVNLSVHPLNHRSSCALGYTAIGPWYPTDVIAMRSGAFAGKHRCLTSWPWLGITNTETNCPRSTN